MAILSGGVFKTQQNKRFEYKPRYFDPEKEDLERRVAEAKKKYGNEDENGDIPDYKYNIRTQMRANRDYSSLKDKSHRRLKFTIRVITIAFMLIAGVLLYELIRNL
ncbi:MAG: hypothetical protein JXR58_09815 [Bacteroidales bacterium]|nr:hypothetical protein [Bacteroidales bacterium]